MRKTLAAIVLVFVLGVMASPAAAFLPRTRAPGKVCHKVFIVYDDGTEKVVKICF